MVHSQDHATRQPICGDLAGEITDYRGRSLKCRFIAIAMLHLWLSVVLTRSGLAQSPASGSQKAADKPANATAKEVPQVEPKEVTPDTKPGSPNPPPSAKATNPSGTDPATASEGLPDKKALAPEKALEGNAKLVRLSPTDEIWIDPNKKRVVVGGTVCLREGFLEMFACPKGTKEHESIVSVNAKAYQMHTALLAIGARVGNPVKYDPYRSASGSIIRVEVVWHDQNGKTTRRPAQSMIRDSKSKENMKADWVFAGSGFWVDAQSGEKYYQAEGGELICLSNFSTAMLDLPVESSRDNASLLFEADSDKIPPRGTHVLLVLTVAGFHQGDDSK